MKTVLISAPYMLPHMERFGPILESFGLELIIPEVNERLSEEELMIYAGQFDGTICGDDRYTKKVIEACASRLKVISKWGTGMLDSAMKAGQWRKCSGKTLSECTLGVIGVGNVGKAVLRRARQFGMKLLGNDIIEIEPDFLLEYGVEMTDLSDLMRRVDYISVNCTLNPTSFHLVNAEMLSLCKHDAVLINTARGPIVDESALIDALENGHIGGAALDVFEVEPLPQDSLFMKMDNVMLAPHNSNSSPFFWERVHWNTIRNLLLGLELPAEKLDVFKAE